MPQIFVPIDIPVLRAALLCHDPIRDMDWPRALMGDSAAACGVAIRVMKATGMNDPMVDTALSALLCCAVEGDPTAPVVILSALIRRGRFDRRCLELSRYWQPPKFNSRP
jgi:hypothetical protein